MSKDSIEPGTSADAYELDDTEPSVATSEQSGRDAALAANEYPYESESARAEEEFPPLSAEDDPSLDYVDSAGYAGGLADIGLADPEIEQAIEESDYEPDAAPLDDTGRSRKGLSNAEENPTGLGAPSPTAEGHPNYEQNTTGLGDPNSQHPDEFRADPAAAGPTAAMPPIRPGDLPQLPEPGPDIPQPQVPDTPPEPPGRDPDRPEPPSSMGGLGSDPGPGSAGEPTIPLPDGPGLGIRPPRPPMRREATDPVVTRGTLLAVGCVLAALLALEFISIAIVLGLAGLVGLPWAMLTVGTTWLVAAAAFGLAGGSSPARRGALPEAVDSLTMTGLRGRLA